MGANASDGPESRVQAPLLSLLRALPALRRKGITLVQTGSQEVVLAHEVELRIGLGSDNVKMLGERVCRRPDQVAAEKIAAIFFHTSADREGQQPYPISANYQSARRS